MLGEVERAREDLDEALVREGRAPEIWIQLAVVEQEVGNHAAALQYLSVAEDLAPEHPQIHLNRAYSLERLDRFGPALLAYRSYLQGEAAGDAARLRPRVLRRVATIAQALEQGGRDRTATDTAAIP